MATATNDKAYLPPSSGTILKIAVTADIGNGLHLADVDFECVFYRDGFTTKSQAVAKKDMIRMDDDTYIAMVNTKLVGLGNYFCRLTVLVPDNDVEGGIRPEVVSFPTYIRVQN